MCKACWDRSNVSRVPHSQQPLRLALGGPPGHVTARAEFLEHAHRLSSLATPFYNGDRKDPSTPGPHPRYNLALAQEVVQGEMLSKHFSQLVGRLWWLCVDGVGGFVQCGTLGVAGDARVVTLLSAHT